ncbi:TlpA family protein disulfide reductase [Gaopeijia maritima]|uniref:TlpA family protein disulfide reductase n=1 Tax=Gaopeijia maritima TaxID=3119007 RepID=UPI0038684BCE
MRRGARWARGWGAVGVIAVAAGLGAGHARAQSAGDPLVHPDPAWELRTLDGERFTLGDLRGRPVFVNLWATWCPPCVAELASIDRLAAEVGDAATFLLVSPEDERAVREFARRRQLGVRPVLESTLVPEEFGLEALPHTVILDAGGGLVLRHRGAADWHTPEVEALLRRLATERSPVSGPIEPTLRLESPPRPGGPWTLEVGVPAGWSLYAPASADIDLGLPLAASWLSGTLRASATLSGPAPITETGEAGVTEVYRGRVWLRVTAPRGPVDALEVRWALCRADRCVPGTSRVEPGPRARPSAAA